MYKIYVCFHKPKYKMQNNNNFKKLAKQNAIIRHLSEKTITEKLLFCTSFTLHEFKLYCSYLINVLKKILITFQSVTQFSV